MVAKGAVGGREGKICKGKQGKEVAFVGPAVRSSHAVRSWRCSVFNVLPLEDPVHSTAAPLCGHLYVVKTTTILPFEKVEINEGNDK